MKSEQRLGFASCLALILFCATASAGPLSGGRPARPSEPPARSGSAASRGATKPTGKNMSDQQTANVQKLQSDLAAIKSGWAVTEEQKTAVKNSLMAVADGATKPSEESVTALADSLSSALADEQLTNKEKAQLASCVETVLKSANIPQAEVEALANSTYEMLVATGVSKEEASAVAQDLKAIGAELKKNASAAAAAR